MPRSQDSERIYEVSPAAERSVASHDPTAYPLVSIAIPVFQGERYIEQAVRSALAQTWPHLEIIISDNASTDGTGEICRALARGDGRVVYSRNNHNVGSAANFRRCFEMSSGMYFKWLAADEAIESTFVERCFAELQRNPDSVLASSRFYQRDEFRGVDVELPWDYAIGDEDVVKRLRRLFLESPDSILPVWGLIRAEVLRDTGLIRSFVGADQCLMVELGMRGTFAQVPDHLALLRTHADAYHAMRYGTKGVEGRAQAAWFDPTRNWRFVVPHARRVFEFARLVARGPVEPWDRLRLLTLFVLPLLGRWSGTIVKELLFTLGLSRLFGHGIRERLRRAVPFRSRVDEDVAGSTRSTS